MDKYKKTIFWIGINTSGINPEKHALIEFAGIVEIENVLIDSLDIKIQPLYDNIIDYANELGQFSMQWGEFKFYNIPALWNCYMPFNKKKVNELNEGILPLDAIKIIREFIIRNIDIIAPIYYLGGYNINFSISFLCEFFKKNYSADLIKYINKPMLDPLYLFYNFIYKNFNINCDIATLKEIASMFNIEYIKEDLISNIEAARKAWYILNMRKSEKIIRGKIL